MGEYYTRYIWAFIVKPKILTKSRTITRRETNEPTQGQLANVVVEMSRSRCQMQMWWLRCHARDVRCEFAFATDCGTILDPLCIGLLIECLQNEAGIAGATGFQRGMTPEMQCDDPEEYRLRSCCVLFASTPNP